MHQQQTTFENIVGKGEIAHNKQFLLYPQCFQLSEIKVSPFVHIFDIISLFAIELEEPKIGISGKGLTRMTACWTWSIQTFFLVFINKNWDVYMKMYSGQSFFGHVPFDTAWGTGHSCLSLYQTTFYTCPNWKHLQTTKEMQIKNKNLVLTWKKTMWEKKMLVSKLKAHAYEKKICNSKIYICF